MREPSEVRELLRRVLASAHADEAEVQYRADRTIATRFGESAITQNTVCADEVVTVELTFGRRRGSASTNRLDGAGGFEVLVARAEVAARASPEDPELVALPDPQTYGARPPRWFDDTAAMAPEAVADDVARVVVAAGAGYRASGLFQVSASQTAVANSRGLFGWDAETSAEYATTVHGLAGSGKAVQSQSSHGRLDVGELARTAVENARRAQGPVAIAPGDYTVVFEPLALRGLLGFLPYALDARAAAEGTTAFADATGRALENPLVSIGLETDDAELPAPTMGRSGEAIRPARWIEGGAVQRLAHDRFWARERGTHADPAVAPLFVSGGTGTVGDLVAGCERGLLVKDLWYIRNVDWRSFTLTGMTRDGVYWIEDGRVVRPVRNLRWNESPLTFLRNLVALSRAVRVSGQGKFPGARSEGFTFTSVTDSV